MLTFLLQELPESDEPLIHRHIYFGHAYKVSPVHLCSQTGFLPCIQFTCRRDLNVWLFIITSLVTGLYVSLHVPVLVTRVRPAASFSLFDESNREQRDDNHQPYPNATRANSRPPRAVSFAIPRTRVDGRSSFVALPLAKVLSLIWSTSLTTLVRAGNA